MYIHTHRILGTMETKRGAPLCAGFKVLGCTCNPKYLGHPDQVGHLGGKGLGFRVRSYSPNRSSISNEGAPVSKIELACFRLWVGVSYEKNPRGPMTQQYFLQTSTYFQFSSELPRLLLLLILRYWGIKYVTRMEFQVGFRRGTPMFKRCRGGPPSRVLFCFQLTTLKVFPLIGFH